MCVKKVTISIKLIRERSIAQNDPNKNASMNRFFDCQHTVYDKLFYFFPFKSYIYYDLTILIFKYLLWNTKTTNR